MAQVRLQSTRSSGSEYGSFSWKNRNRNQQSTRNVCGGNPEDTRESRRSHQKAAGQDTRCPHRVDIYIVNPHIVKSVRPTASVTKSGYCPTNRKNRGSPAPLPRSMCLQRKTRSTTAIEICLLASQRLATSGRLKN